MTGVMAYIIVFLLAFIYWLPDSLHSARRFQQPFYKTIGMTMVLATISAGVSILMLGLFVHLPILILQNIAGG